MIHWAEPANVRSFWGEVIKRTAEIEKALGESKEFAASLGLLQL